MGYLFCGPCIPIIGAKALTDKDVTKEEVIEQFKKSPNIIMQARVVIEKITVVRDKAKDDGSEGPVTAEHIAFRAVSKEDGPYGEDGLDANNSFARFSPSLDIQMSITNPALFDQYHEGQVFNLGFDPIPGT
jgi:hypothetical protein